MSVRKYMDSDFDSVIEIINEAFSEIDINISHDELMLDDSHVQVVYEDEGKVVGYSLVNKVFDPFKKRLNYWIEYVCVLSTYRGRGIGKELIKYIEDMAKDENVLYLQLTSNRKRVSARKMYSDLGFSIRESDIFRKVI